MFRPHIGALALVAALVLPLAASAQTFSGPGGAPPAAAGPAHAAHHGRHHNRYMHAMHGLQLSDAQRRQVRGFMQSARQANKGADRQTRRANMVALRQQIDGVLSPDQRTQFHANLKQDRARMVRPNGPNGAAPQGPPPQGQQ